MYVITLKYSNKITPEKGEFINSECLGDIIGTRYIPIVLSGSGSRPERRFQACFHLLMLNNDNKRTKEDELCQVKILMVPTHFKVHNEIYYKNISSILLRMVTIELCKHEKFQSWV